MSRRLENPSDHRGPPTKKWQLSRRGSGSLTSKSFRWNWLFQFRRAVRTELVRLCNLSFAIGTGRIQVALTVRAKIEPRTDRLFAARAGIRERLAHQQINDQADDADGSRKHKEHKPSPQRRVHATALRVAIHVAEHEDASRENEGDSRDDPNDGQHG